MPFKLELHISGIRELPGHEQVEATEDLELLALPLCELLSDAGAVFVAGGFGDDDWPVDVRYDLASVVPQFPALLASLESGSSAEIDFFEQGIQRTVAVTYEGDRVHLQCHSSGRWKPAFPEEQMSRARFSGMVSDLTRHFSKAVTVVAPEISGLSQFRDWRSG